MALARVHYGIASQSTSPNIAGTTPPNTPAAIIQKDAKDRATPRTQPDFRWSSDSNANYAEEPRTCPLGRRSLLSPAKAKKSLPTIATSIGREHKRHYEGVFQQAFTRIFEH